MLAPSSLMSARDAKGANAPEAPSGVGASQDTSTSALVTWEDNSNREDNFVIYRQVDGGGYTQHDTVGANTESYTDSGLSKGSTYDYEIAAKNEAGESDRAGPGSVTIQDVPAQPTNLTATAISPSRIDLSWTDNATNEDEYRVQERVSGSFTTIDTIAADSTSYSHTGLEEGTTHEYRVQACNNLAGCSSSRSTDEVTTPLDAPIAFDTQDNDTYVRLTWTDVSDKEQGYEIYRDGSLFVTENANTEQRDISCPDAEGDFKVRAVHSEIPASDFTVEKPGVDSCSDGGGGGGTNGGSTT